jgi:hypothetical protein
LIQEKVLRGWYDCSPLCFQIDSYRNEYRIHTNCRQEPQQAVFLEPSYIQTQPSDIKNKLKRYHCYQNLLPQDAIIQVVQHLRRSTDYKVLLERSWLQPMTGNSFKVLINAAPSTPAAEEANFSKDNAPPWFITGYVRFKPSPYRYVYGHVNLNYVKNVANDEPQTIRIKLKRRITPEKLTYIDNPALGILIKIKPYATEPSSNDQ